MTVSGVKELVIVSGKGGTGKTTVSGSFAHLSQGAVFCDCDVDAANLSLLLENTVVETQEFGGGLKARIDARKCDACGICEKSCRFHAIESLSIDPVFCEGCGLCQLLCPTRAIEMYPELSGHWYVSETARGPLVHARLEPGGDNSGRLVTVVRNRARELCLSQGRHLVITDGPPGIGCPVISSLSGADLALLVTEPTLSGIHDLKRVMEVCRRLNVRTTVCINKYDVDLDNTERIRAIAGQTSPVVGLIPYDQAVPRAMDEGVPVVTFKSPAATALVNLWTRVREELHREGAPSRRAHSKGR